MCTNNLLPMVFFVPFAPMKTIGYTLYSIHHNTNKAMDIICASKTLLATYTADLLFSVTLIKIKDRNPTGSASAPVATPMLDRDTS